MQPVPVTMPSSYVTPSSLAVSEVAMSLEGSVHVCIGQSRLMPNTVLKQTGQKLSCGYIELFVEQPNPAVTADT